MVITTILDGIKAVLLYVIGLFPDMSALQLPTGFITWFTEMAQAAAYFLPLPDFFIMFGIWLMVTNWTIFYKTVMKIWGALPFT